MENASMKGLVVWLSLVVISLVGCQGENRTPVNQPVSNAQTNIPPTQVYQTPQTNTPPAQVYRAPTNTSPPVNQPIDTSPPQAQQIPSNIPPTRVHEVPKTFGEAANQKIDGLEGMVRTMEDEARIQVSQDQGVDLKSLSCPDLAARADQFRAIYEQSLQAGDTVRAKQANKLERQVRSELYIRSC